MIESIIILMCIILPSFILGYCVKWMMDEELIAKKIQSNKASNILPPIN
jgi:fructose-specific phosphotransferase system IIC component